MTDETRGVNSLSILRRQLENPWALFGSRGSVQCCIKLETREGERVWQIRLRYRPYLKLCVSDRACPWILHVSPSRPSRLFNVDDTWLAASLLCNRAHCGNACQSKRGNERCQLSCCHLLHKGALSIHHSRPAIQRFAEGVGYAVLYG